MAPTQLDRALNSKVRNQSLPMNLIHSSILMFDYRICSLVRHRTILCVFNSKKAPKSNSLQQVSQGWWLQWRHIPSGAPTSFPPKMIPKAVSPYFTAPRMNLINIHRPWKVDGGRYAKMAPCGMSLEIITHPLGQGQGAVPRCCNMQSNNPSQRGLLPNENATREELLERVKANLRIPRTSKSAASQQ